MRDLATCAEEVGDARSLSGREAQVSPWGWVGVVNSKLHSGPRSQGPAAVARSYILRNLLSDLLVAKNLPFLGCGRRLVVVRTKSIERALLLRLLRRRLARKLCRRLRRRHLLVNPQLLPLLRAE